MKTNLSRNVIIAITFIVSLALLIFGINFLKGVNIFKKQNTYTAVFDDVLGLNVSSPVYINGFQIGLVNSINMIQESPLKFGVEIRLDKGFRVKKGSRAEFGADLLGGSSLKLLVNEYATEYLTPGDTIQGMRAAGMMDGVARVVPKADTILMHIDSVVLALNKLIQDPSWKSSITGIDQTIRSLNVASANITTMTRGLNQQVPTIASNLNVVSGDLKSVSEKLNRIDLDKTYKELDKTIANLNLISQKLNTPDNTLGKLTSSTELHDSLNVTIQNATRLLEDIRKNPERYLSVKVRLF